VYGQLGKMVMELTYDILLKVCGGLIGVYLLLSLFDVNWLTRMRTIVSLLIGVVLVGWPGWAVVRPEDPLGAITLIGGSIGAGAMIYLCGLAFAAGLVAYLASWPKGLLTAPLAAPAGMAVWVFASGDMRTLLLYHSTLAQRQQVYATLGWEGLFWLLPVLAGLGGVGVGWMIQNRKKPSLSMATLTANGKLFWAAVAVAASVIIVQLIINLFAQDVPQSDAQVGRVIGQPGKGQVVFAVFTAFLAAGFVAKYFAKINYLIPTLCTAVAVYWAMHNAATPAVLEAMTTHWSVAYFAKSIYAVLPLQMITFGALGAFTGCQAAQKMLTHQKQA
jgi:hypothetical protein